MSKLADQRMVLVDTETFGLNPNTDPVIEIGFLITTLDFVVIDRFSTTIWDEGYNDKFSEMQSKINRSDKSSRIVFDMHTKSGLWNEAHRSRVTVQQATQNCIDFCMTHQIEGQDPMVGSSVHFDRSMLTTQLPEVAARFHYRNIDISTIKEACRRFNPHVFEQMFSHVPNRQIHRAIPDCEDSLEELHFYYDNFLFVKD